MLLLLILVMLLLLLLLVKLLGVVVRLVVMELLLMGLVFTSPPSPLCKMTQMNFMIHILPKIPRYYLIK